MIPEPPETDDLRALLRENIAVAKDNNRLLREMRRNAIIGFVIKIAVYLVLLGVPLFILGTYLGPILERLSGAGAVGPGDIERLLGEYRATLEP